MVQKVNFRSKSHYLEDRITTEHKPNEPNEDPHFLKEPN